MPRSRVNLLVASAAALLALPAVAAFAYLPVVRPVAVADGEGVAAEKGFRHGSHLAPDWQATDRKLQFDRHCKECHDVQKDQPFGLAPTVQHCARCHYSDPAQPGHDAARLELRGGERPPARPGAYDHSLPGHRERACIDCHRPAPGPRGDFAHPDVRFDVPASLAVCADCHHHGADDPGKAGQRDVFHDGSTAAWRRTWDQADACADCHKAGTPRMLDRHRRSKERVFEHASHVPSEDLGAASAGTSCAGCHAMDNAAAANAMGVELKSCGQCHFADLGASTTKVIADLEVQQVPTKFSHATKGHREACSTCHPMANDATDPAVGRMYADCTTKCHAERRVPRHGSWSCTECHANDNPRSDDEAKALATTTVARPAEPSTFAFARTAHPGVTTAGEPVHPVADGRACTDCHRRPVEGLARATLPRPFAHEGHLQDVSSTTPTAACVKCHAHVADTKSPQFVFAFHRGAAKEAGVCTAMCHQSPRMDVAGEPVEVRVPVFSHQQHASQPCAACHVGAGGITDLRAATLTDQANGAFSCARCHGHKDPEKVKVTGGYETTKESNVCFECHVEREGRAFAKETRREQRYQLVAEQRQFHAKGGACRNCHAYEDQQRAPGTAPIVVVEHRNLHRSHDVTTGGTSRKVPDVKRTDCAACHRWDPVGR